MDAETFAWLLSPAGGAVVGAAAGLRGEGDDPVRTAERLRRAAPTATPEQRAAALTQVELRARAVTKLGEDAAKMWFTPEGLEQATRATVARHRASRLALVGRDDRLRVIDLGCGIGSDLVAMSRAGLVVAGVDSDPVRVAVARANLAALDLPGAVQVADATRLDLAPFDVAFADPARRSGSGRTFRAEEWTPPWAFVRRLLERPSVVKVAPGIPHDLVPGGVEAEWVSDAGEVKEAALWSPALASCGRRATVIGHGGLATLTEEDDPYAGGPRPVRGLGGYLYEPDGAVVRAGLVTAVAAGVGGGLLDERIAWVTSDQAFRTPFARGYRVLERLPFREKQLRRALRERGIGRLTIKKRGVDVVPEVLRQRLALRGDREATLVLTRVADAATAVLVQPMDAPRTR